VGCRCTKAERVEEIGECATPRRHAAVGQRQVPRHEALVLGQWLEQRGRIGVVERQQRDPFVTIDGRDATRREAAEPSAAVVQENRPAMRHGGDSARSLDWLSVTHLVQEYQSWALVLLFALVAIESAGVPLPGETALIASAVLASQGKLDIVEVIAVAAAAAIVGDNVGYFIGRTGGRALLEKWSFLERHSKKVLPRAERLFARHGGKTVFFGRFVAILRVTSAWMAGVSHMPWWRFFAFNAAGGILWATLVGLVAYYLGSAAADAIQTYGLIAGVVIAVGIVAVVLGVRWWERRMLGGEE